METVAETSLVPIPCKSVIYDEVAMRKRLLFSDGLKDLKNLRKQLYSAAEYFEFSYTNDDQKHVVVNTLKDYAMKALVNTVDHLGSMSCKVNGLLDDKLDEFSKTELRISSIHQRLQTCREYVDREGLSQQSLTVDPPKYYRRYVLPSGETMRGGVRTKSKFQGCMIEDKDDWRRLKNAIRAAMQEPPVPTPEVSKWLYEPTQLPASTKLAQQKEGNITYQSNKLNKDSGRKTEASPRRFAPIRSISIKPTSSSTPRTSRSSTPNNSRPTTPNSSSLDHQFTIPESRKSSSTEIRVPKESGKDGGSAQGRSKRILKSLLSRRRSRKDEMLYTYLDEY